MKACGWINSENEFIYCGDFKEGSYEDFKRRCGHPKLEYTDQEYGFVFFRNEAKKLLGETCRTFYIDEMTTIHNLNVEGKAKNVIFMLNKRLEDETNSN